MTYSESSLVNSSALIVGLGGLGCPAAWVLARAGIGRLLLVDDDAVEQSNLHRQILYGPEDVGLHKLDAAARSLEKIAGSPTQIERLRSRLLPENARDLIRQVDVILEGADNFATKFLVADACKLEARPVVHGAAVRWRATVWCVGPAGTPCYRCLFEDMPNERASMNCAEAGVMGPVVGLAGALMAELAMRVLRVRQVPFGKIFTYEGKKDQLREVDVPARPECPLCGSYPRIGQIEEKRYTAPGCAA